MRGPLIVKRAFSEPLLLFAALGSILLATTTLVALTMYASSIADIGVKRTMETASFGATSAAISAPVTGETFGKLDQVVRDQTSEAYAGLPTKLTTSFRSDSFVVPGQESRAKPELIRFGSYDGLDQHAKLISGSWPGPGDGDTVEAAVPAPAASATGFKAGDVITTQSRIDKKPVTVKITGVFQLNDPFGDRWTGEPLLSRGIEVGSFTTYGPLMVGRDTFLDRFATTVTTTWTVVPDLRGVTPEQLRPFAQRVTDLRDELKRAGCPSCTAASDLPGMLNQLNTASLVARSTMLIPVLQLLLLSAYALMLTARLLADHRRMEVALLRSRGAGTIRLATLAGGEALLVAVPCAIVAPFLGPPLLSAVNALPWVQASGVRLSLSAGVGTFLISIGVALAAAILLALPALAGARRTYIEEQSVRGRAGGRGLIERAGADVALLVVAGLAIWQLQHYGAPVTSTASGDLGIDPLIISGPALALLTGGMLGLRLVPRISKIAERYTTARPSLAPALGAWQVARRPLKYAGPALLLTMAIAIGIVSMATASTWRASQTDQARHQAGADLRLSGPPDGGELGAFGRGTAFTALPGVEAASPGYRGGIEFGGGDATLLAVDADKLADVFQLRSDLSGQSVEDMGRAMAAERPALKGLPIPGKPTALDVDVELKGAAAGLRLVLSDGLGVWHELAVGPLRRGPNQLTASLAELGGRAGQITYPLTLHGLLVQPPGTAGAGVTVNAIKADGRALALPQGTRWAGGASGPSALVSMFVAEDAKAALVAPASATDDQVFAQARTGGALVNKPLSVVVTEALATSMKLHVGQVTPLTLDRQVVEVVVAGIVDRMPTTDADENAVLADWETLQARDLVATRLPRPATEWWLSVKDGDSAAAFAELRRHPSWDVSVVDQSRLAVQLRDDPLASGLQGALMLGFIAALIFAALGFLVNAAVAARERMSEFTILRALGISFRQVFGLLAIEQAFVIGLSLLAGTALAIVVGYLVVPHIVLTGQASAVTPDVRLDIPWPATLAMLVLVAALLFAIVAGLARSMRRQGLGQVLRIGEDQ
ncbi:ABC transporter permease [Nonomuraea sp. NBC_01738]|uniref:ABC transporter permease n=1 Tax=Nonomuraea sp. NBC_01738 TaxID=2976003 RepID=UPI002E0FAFAC|nr:ABC transporter permease [Nonomuraea sp. NBC_01738]